jgi:hypothetical protein
MAFGSFGGSIPRMKLQWRIVAATIDRDDLAASEDSELRERFQHALDLARDGGSSSEVAAALMPISFEWGWSNCDGDPSEVFENATDLMFELNDSNAMFEAGMHRGDLAISICVEFEVSVAEGISREDVEDWLQANSAHACGFASGGWCYSGDEGQSVEVIGG